MGAHLRIEKLPRYKKEHLHLPSLNASEGAYKTTAFVAI